MKRLLLAMLLIASLIGLAAPVFAEPEPDAFGNQIPDFSMAGYRHGGVALPVAKVVERLQPVAGGKDDTDRIQAAIRRVAERPARPGDGVKGAVLLERGSVHCGKSLSVPPGVVLRGEGPERTGTVMVATMVPTDGSSPTLIRVEGSVTGHLDVGPPVFLDCLAEKTHSDIGPHHRWACGQLYDNVRGGRINVQDRGPSGTGHGWAGNCQVLWNCVADTIVCQKPWLTSTQNWAIGCTARDGKPALTGRPDGFTYQPN